MKKLVVSFCLTALAATTAATAGAADLKEVYDLAVSNDVEVAGAIATRRASEYDITIARGALLPQVDASYQVGKTDSESEGQNGVFKTEGDFNTLQLSASMSLFNLNSWYNYKAARAGDGTANYQLQIAEQQLILRTAQAYLDILRAQDNLSTAEAELSAVEQSLEQTKERYRLGLSPVTEVNEAQAAYDLSYVNVLGQQATLEVSYESLAVLTSQSIKELSPLLDDAELKGPEPLVMDEWVSSGLAKYPGILLAEEQLEAARLQRNATRSQHLPTVSLFANYSDQEQPGSVSIDQQSGNAITNNSTTTSYGLQISVPLFTGGTLYGQSKKAALTMAAVDYEVEKQRRDVKKNIRSLYLQVNNDVRNITARQQSIRSAESAFEAVKAGYDLGTRNIVEYLDAQKNVYVAEGDYQNARYDYIINLLNLKFYAGVLNEADIDQLNTLLVAGSAGS